MNMILAVLLALMLITTILSESKDGGHLLSEGP